MAWSPSTSRMKRETLVFTLTRPLLPRRWCGSGSAAGPFQSRAPRVPDCRARRTAAPAEARRRKRPVYTGPVSVCKRSTGSLVPVTEIPAGELRQQRDLSAEGLDQLRAKGRRERRTRLPGAVAGHDLPLDRVQLPRADRALDTRVGLAQERRRPANQVLEPQQSHPPVLVDAGK